MQDVVTDEDTEDPEEEEDDHTHKQDSSTGSEVILALCGFAKKQGRALIISPSQFSQGTHTHVKLH